MEVETIAKRLRMLDHQVIEICKTSGCPGLSLGVLHRGQIIHKANYGYCDVEAQVQADSDTIYSINSMSKALTAATVGLLVEDGKLSWDTPIQNVIPEFRSSHDVIDGMTTIADLMSHRTGIATADSFWLQGNNRILLEKNQRLALFGYSKRSNSFRDSFGYNNIAYSIAGLAIEVLSGQDWGERLKDKIFKPLGLRRTVTEPVRESNVAKYYSVLDDRTPCQVPSPKLGDNTLLAGAGGVYSCVNDLLRLYKNFFTAAETQIQQSTTSSSNSLFKQCPTLISAQNRMPGGSLREHTYGLGWVRTQLPGRLGLLGVNASLVTTMPTVGQGSESRLCIWHQGNMPASGSLVYTFPETETVIVVLQNSLALNDTADWVGQLLVETVFNADHKNDYLKLARESANATLRVMPDIAKELEKDRVLGTQHKPLHLYAGTYVSTLESFHIQVSERNNKLQMAFQGLESEAYDLQHYHYDTFSWHMTYNEASKRGRLIADYAASYYLFGFGGTEEGKVNLLFWELETGNVEALTKKEGT
ncbi:MAG: hypothetical protein M1812_000665 [Candelaria pacifica]|nr:MAG: hypothetical protein M1812_000665 [Candelaria pacifica]